MTGGIVVVLGPVGANFGAGMTGGRAYLFDPDGRHLAALDTRSVRAIRLSAAAVEREDSGPALVEELDRASSRPIATPAPGSPAASLADLPRSRRPSGSSSRSPPRLRPGRPSGRSRMSVR